MRVFEHDNIKLINADCMSVMAEYGDKYFDLTICDPPYFKGIGKQGYFGKKNSSIGVKRGDYHIPDWDDNIPDMRYYNELIRVSKHQIIWGINYFDFPVSAGRIVWDKVNDGASFSQCEIAYCSLIDTVRQFRYMWNGMNQAESTERWYRSQGNKKLQEKRIHPTQKPIALYNHCLQNYAKPTDRILDTHLGSASSAIAAHRFGCKEFVGIELDEDYFKAAVKRFKTYLSQPEIDFTKLVQQSVEQLEIFDR